MENNFKEALAQNLDKANEQNAKQQKTLVPKNINLWKYIIPVIFFMLSLVLILQNILLNKKFDRISASIQKSVIEDGKASQTKIEDLDKKITTALLTLDPSTLKDNKERLDEIKGLLQDIRGLSFDGSISQSPQDITNIDSSESINSQIAANTISSPTPDSKVIEVTNIEYYSNELDKIKQTIDENEKDYNNLKADLYTISEKILAEYSKKMPVTEEKKDKSVFSGIIKIKKIDEEDSEDFVGKVKAAAILFENGDYKEAADILETVNQEAKNIELNEYINRLKKYNDSVLDMRQIVTKLESVVKGLKEIAK